MNEPEIPMPSLDISSEADDILKDNAGGLEEFRGLEGGESIDQDFSDLDNINLDDIDLDVDMEEETPPATGGSPSPAESPTTTVKADWIASDAPKGADLPGDEISTQDDMSSLCRRSFRQRCRPVKFPCIRCQARNKRKKYQPPERFKRFQSPGN